MTPEQFCYWLQGRAEMQPDNPPSVEEWKMIAEHLQLVFQKKPMIKLDAVPSPYAYEAARLQGLVDTTLAKKFLSEIPQC
jgi:hypothetical protein